MYLKEIEVSGFKSFADKININLDNKITCIVGPNGSGKSNIVDAIRFVLGEQSVKSLRGDNLMADVIFSGSKNRNAMNAASVCLTFDNQDNYLKIPYNNVSIKRRLYKTGDNEYFINGEKCRLKDIIDLFLDSGMGRDSFNIIGQGEIAKILSNSPIERRFIIEDAAGILKYKKRREEAFKKLDKTNLNLDRLADIILEVEDRLIPLKDQNDKALKYLEIKKQLENVEVATLVLEIENLNNTYQDQKLKIKELEEKSLLYSKQLSNPEIDELKLTNIKLDKKLTNLNQELVLLMKEKETLNNKRLILKEREKIKTNDLKKLDNLNYLKEEKMRLTNELKALNQELTNINTKKQTYENELTNLIDNLDNQKSILTAKEKEYNQKNKDLYQLLNQIDILKTNLADNNYLNNNVKKVLDNPKLTGIYDALVNILKPLDNYQKCLDVLMITSKNFLVVKSINDANLAIQYLKNNNLGRVTFLPLDTIKEKKVDINTLNLLKDVPGYLGVLTDFLEYDIKYQKVIFNQFGNILVANTIKDAITISKIIDNRYRVITIDGEIIYVGGSVSGGNLNDLKSINKIKNDLNNLSLKAKLEKNTLDTLEQELNNQNQEIANLDKTIYEKRTSLIQTIDSLNNLKAKIVIKTKDLDEKQLALKTQENNSFNQELEELNQLYYDKTYKLELKEKEISQIQEEKNLLQSKILELEGINKVINQNLSKNEKELANLNLLITKTDAKLDNNLNILNQEYNLTYERARLEYNLDIDLEIALKQVLEYKNQLKTIGMVNTLAIDEYKSVNERYKYLDNQRNDLLKARDMLYTIIEEMDEVMKNDFKTTFEILQVEFKKVFKELFKGGDASLKLTNPDNLLDTGVEIIASPPGKKLKTISLLSGGEKTLTAISLLFAILNIRKVPFCIFDEVEAALDEANVANFGKYLNHYQDKTQFLLITHKKKTMEYAKTLYGITMQESGVSKFVSVKLEEDENE